MTEVFILDGYNIIYSWPELRDFGEKNPEAAREKLTEMMINYAGLTGHGIKIIFDAHLVKGGKRSQEKKDGIEVFYTKQGETADQLIEKMILQNSGEKVFVVTGDQTEQWVTFGRGAYRMTPGELREEVKRELEKMGSWNQESPASATLLFQRLNSGIKEILERWRREKQSKGQ